MRIGFGWVRVIGVCCAIGWKGQVYLVAVVLLPPMIWWGTPGEAREEAIRRGAAREVLEIERQYAKRRGNDGTR